MKINPLGSFSIPFIKSEFNLKGPKFVEEN